MDERQHHINEAWARILQEKRAPRVPAETVDEGAAGKARPWSEILSSLAAEAGERVTEKPVENRSGALPWSEVIRQVEAEGRSAR
jgi:hypothetical protein